MNAISVVGETLPLNVVMTGLVGKHEQQKTVDSLIHRHAPDGESMALLSHLRQSLSQLELRWLSVWRHK